MCDLMRRHLWPVPLFLAVVSSGCGQRPPEPSRAVTTAPDAVATRAEVLPDVEKTPAKEITPAPTAPLRTAATGTSSSAGEAPVVADHAIPAAAEPAQGSAPAEPPGPTRPDARSLDEQLAGLHVPPAWLEEVRTQYDTSHPWKDARLEIRRLLSLNTEAARKEAIKLTWIYLQKKDIGDGHEYPMYLFLGGEPLWAVRAHKEFLAQPHEVAPDHAYISLAVLYTHFGEFAKAQPRSMTRWLVCRPRPGGSRGRQVCMRRMVTCSWPGPNPTWRKNTMPRRYGSIRHPINRTGSTC